MGSRERHPFQRRASLVRAIFLLVMVMIGGRFLHLQVFQHEKLAELGRKQSEKRVRMPARRGNILDRNGQSLAVSVDVPSIYADPSRVSDARHAARELARVLDVNLDTLYRRLASDRLFVWLKRQVTPQVEAEVKALNLSGVSVIKEAKRFYPNREVGAKILGFTNVDGQGLEGVERSFEQYLAGESHVVRAMRDARGRSVLEGGLDAERLTRGDDVRMTVDFKIQHAAHIALERVKLATQAKSAMAVVLDVQSSEVLAMASVPTFNPNQRGGSPLFHRRNSVLTDMFEPGSTMKPFVVAAALNTGVIESDATVFCEDGKIHIGSHTIRDSHPYGWMGLTDIIKKSSNIGAAKVGMALGSQALYDSYVRLGFGRRTGVRFPGEVGGILRHADKWSEVSTATMSFGHGMAVNLLQLAAAYRVLASGGMYQAPKLLLAIEQPDGGVTMAPKSEQVRVFRLPVAHRVNAMLEQVIHEGGTGWRAHIDGYRVAGKTGTAQKLDPVTKQYSDRLYWAIFAGFLPADAPRAVIVVAVNEPLGDRHTGGAVAAPVFREIASVTMRELKLLPSESMAPVVQAQQASKLHDSESIRPVLDRLKRHHKGDIGPQNMPRFVGLTLRQACERYTKADLLVPLTVEGSGVVVKQRPVSGTRRRQVDGLHLVLAER